MAKKCCPCKPDVVHVKLNLSQAREANCNGGSLLTIESSGDAFNNSLEMIGKLIVKLLHAYDLSLPQGSSLVVNIKVA